MSQRFIRCGHCGFPHPADERICPSTGHVVRPDRGGASAGRSEPPVAARPGVDPPPARSPSAPMIAPPGRPSRHDLVGKTLGERYLVRSILGEGGMGTVFEAQAVGSGSLVAVKVLHPSQAGKKNAIRRFHQEARATSMLGHPNICAVYELGALDGGSPYLVMERLVGRTLGDRIASEKRLPCIDVVDALVQVLAALMAAHQKGIVHRDIKPDNVFLATDPVGTAPVVKLLDFGVSKMFSAPVGEGAEDVDLTRIGMVMGTPHYLSPEQARGDRDLDGRVDVYACGVILYEALGGRRPFSAPNYDALLMQILTSRPRRLTELRPDVPAALEAVVEKAMARERSDRYQTAAALRHDLLEVRGLVTRARAPEQAEDEAPPSSTCVEPPPATPIDIPISVSEVTLPSPESISVDVPISASASALPDAEDPPAELMTGKESAPPFSKKSET